jgi:uncharacterized iron-regulated membrane protein
MRARGRRVWLATHRWLGLGVGVLFVLSGLTGSAIVFDHALDAWLNPELFTPRAPGPPRPLDEILAAARAAVPGPIAGVTVSMPGVDYDVFVVHLSRPATAEGDRESVDVPVDPASGRVLGQRPSDGHLTAWLYRLHSSLLLGDALGVDDLGSYVVGGVGLVLLGSALSGLYLWWPRCRQLGQAVGVRWRASGKRVTFDLHRATGFWGAAVLLTLAFSGVYLIFPEWVRALVGTLARTEPRPPGLVSKPPAGAATPIPIGRAAAIAAGHVPDGALTFVVVPERPTGVYQVWLRRTDDVRRVYGDVIVWIDQWSGAVLRVRDRRALPGGEIFLHWQFPLHSGEAFARAGRLLVFVTGLTPLLLAVTGTLIWWLKRRARRRIRRRAGEPNVGAPTGSEPPGAQRALAKR